jgi:hypothetical protein
MQKIARELPLAAGINEGGAVVKILEVVVVGFQIFARAPN